MKRKDIEKAAGEYSGSVLGFKDNPVVMAKHKAFTAGADWRINIVWHEVSERPDENEPTIIERENGKFSLHEKGYDGPWKYNVEQFNFKRWAYVKDLIPDKED